MAQNYFVTFYPPTNESNYLISSHTAESIETLIDNLTVYVSPVISCTSLFFNILCFLILKRPSFKGSLNKYLFVNSIFDIFALVLIALKPLLQDEVTETVSELYFFIYLISVCMTCSSLTKIAFSFDRLTRMTSKYRFLFRRSQCFIIFMYMSIACLINSPIFFNLNKLIYKWYKMTYFEMTLNENGTSGLLNIFFILSGNLFDLSCVICIILNVFLLRSAIKRNMKTIEQIVEIEKNKSTQFVIDLGESQEKETIERDEEETINDDQQFTDGLSMRTIQTNLDDVEDVEMIGDKSTTKKRKHNPIEIEEQRRRLCQIVLFANMAFLLGHGPYAFWNFILQVVDLSAGPVKVYVGYNYQAHLDLVNCLTNLLVQLTCGLNFFIYFYFSQSFQISVKNSFKKFFQCLFCICLPRANYSKPDLFKE